MSTHRTSAASDCQRLQLPDVDEQVVGKPPVTSDEYLRLRSSGVPDQTNTVRKRLECYHFFVSNSKTLCWAREIDVLGRDTEDATINQYSFNALDGVSSEYACTIVEALCDPHTYTARPPNILSAGFVFQIIDVREHPDQLFVLLKVKGHVATAFAASYADSPVTWLAAVVGDSNYKNIGVVGHVDDVVWKLANAKSTRRSTNRSANFWVPAYQFDGTCRVEEEPSGE